jgi:hypothetical protein
METSLRWQDPSQKTIIMQTGKPVGYAQMTVTSAAASLPSIPAGANKAIIQIETQGNVRWRDDGTAPTSTVGMPLYAGNAIQYDVDKSITNLQFILLSDTTTNVTLNVSYYQKA